MPCSCVHWNDKNIYSKSSEFVIFGINGIFRQFESSSLYTKPQISEDRELGAFTVIYY